MRAGRDGDAVLRWGRRRGPQHLQRARRPTRRPAPRGCERRAALLRHEFVVRGVRQGRDRGTATAHPLPAARRSAVRTGNHHGGTGIAASRPEDLQPDGRHPRGCTAGHRWFTPVRQGGRRAAQRRRQGHRRRAAGWATAGFRRCPGDILTRLVRTRAEGRDGRHRDADRRIGPVVIGRRVGRTHRPYPDRVHPGQWLQPLFGWRSESSAAPDREHLRRDVG